MKNKLWKLSVLATALVVCLAFTACGGGESSGSGSAPAAADASGTSGSYADGTYEGRSSDFEADESGNGAGYGQVQIEIKDGSIASCTFTLYELDGTVKDETYGADLSKENRLKAQKAVQSADKYASMLVENGSLSGVDAISGATISHNEFIEAVNDALSKAAQ